MALTSPWSPTCWSTRWRSRQAAPAPAKKSHKEACREKGAAGAACGGAELRRRGYGDETLSAEPDWVQRHRCCAGWLVYAETRKRGAWICTNPDCLKFGNMPPARKPLFDLEN